MRFLLIPVADALPAVEAHLARWPTDDQWPSSEELRELIRVTVGFVAAADALLAYIKTLTGRPNPNCPRSTCYPDTPQRTCPGRRWRTRESADRRHARNIPPGGTANLQMMLITRQRRTAKCVHDPRLGMPTSARCWRAAEGPSLGTATSRYAAVAGRVRTHRGPSCNVRCPNR